MNLQSIEFKTCLRRIRFFEYDDGCFLINENLKNNEVQSTQAYEQQEAVVFLVELLCGLKSRIIGETEIFGQFKLFYDNLNAQEKSLFLPESFINFIFTSVKQYRDQVIKHWGVKSYGSLIRKIVKNYSSVTVAGTGHLAQELIPWLSQKNIQILSRHSQDQTQVKLLQLGLEEHFLKPLKWIKFNDDLSSTLQEVLIIAAPLSHEMIFKILKSNPQIQMIIDCRALNSTDQQSLKVQTHIQGINQNVLSRCVELQDLFAELEFEQKKLLENVDELKVLIQKKVDTFINRSLMRPQGWEDLWI